MSCPQNTAWRATVIPTAKSPQRAATAPLPPALFARTRCCWGPPDPLQGLDWAIMRVASDPLAKAINQATGAE